MSVIYCQLSLLSRPKSMVRLDLPGARSVMMEKGPQLLVGRGQHNHKDLLQSLGTQREKGSVFPQNSASRDTK